MAASKCNNCDNKSFEIVQATPSYSNYKYNFVQCSICGSVVGVLDYFNIGSKFHELEKKVALLPTSNNNSEIKVIHQNIVSLFHNLDLLGSKIDGIDIKLNQINNDKELEN